MEAVEGHPLQPTIDGRIGVFGNPSIVTPMGPELNTKWADKNIKFESSYQWPIIQALNPKLYTVSNSCAIAALPTNKPSV